MADPKKIARYDVVEDCQGVRMEPIPNAPYVLYEDMLEWVERAYREGYTKGHRACWNCISPDPAGAWLKSDIRKEVLG